MEIHATFSGSQNHMFWAMRYVCALVVKKLRLEIGKIK